MTKNELVKHALTFKHGGMSYNELYALSDICEGKKVLELGSMVGMSSYVIGNVCSSLDCVDLWSDNQDHLIKHDPNQAQIYKNLKLSNMYELFLSNCSVFINTGKINMHRGKTLDVVDEFSDKSFDVILLDADHSYHGVSRDFYAYENKLKDDGLFVFHDYGDEMWTAILHFCNEMVAQNRIKYVKNYERIGVFQKVL